MLSDEVAVAFGPSRAYVRLAAADRSPTWLRALERPFIVLLVIATGVALVTTGRVTVSLLATAMLAWSFAVLVQLAAGALLVASAPDRPVSMPAALDLLFAGHLPWSLWLLVAAAWTTAAIASVPIVVVAATLVIPIVWTQFVLAAFCRAVLRTTASGARGRVALHQLLIWSFVLNYIAWNAGGWFRLVLW